MLFALGNALFAVKAFFVSNFLTATIPVARELGVTQRLVSEGQVLATSLGAPNLCHSQLAVRVKYWCLVRLCIFD